jgi:hypothetical protein
MSGSMSLATLTEDVTRGDRGRCRGAGVTAADDAINEVDS